MDRSTKDMVLLGLLDGCRRFSCTTNSTSRGDKTVSILENELETILKEKKGMVLAVQSNNDCKVYVVLYSPEYQFEGPDDIKLNKFVALLGVPMKEALKFLEVIEHDSNNSPTA